MPEKCHTGDNELKECRYYCDKIVIYRNISLNMEAGSISLRSNPRRKSMAQGSCAVPILANRRVHDGEDRHF